MDTNLRVRFACMHGDFETVKQLASYLGVCIHHAVISAARYGHLEIVKFLVSLPRFEPSPDGDYALISGSISGNVEVVKFIASIPGVDPTFSNNGAFMEAVSCGNVDIAKFLASIPAVKIAAREDHDTEYIKYARIDITENRRHVSKAVRERDSLNMTKFLVLDLGIEPTASDVDHYSRTGPCEVAKFLKRYISMN